MYVVPRVSATQYTGTNGTELCEEFGLALISDTGLVLIARAEEDNVTIMANATDWVVAQPGHNWYPYPDEFWVRDWVAIPDPAVN